MDDVKMDAGDVTVVEKEQTLCDDCGGVATHYVMLDMRATGARSAVAELCHAHAVEFAERLRASMPTAGKDAGHG